MLGAWELQGVQVEKVGIHFLERETEVGRALPAALLMENREVKARAPGEKGGTTGAPWALGQVSHWLSRRASQAAGLCCRALQKSGEARGPAQGGGSRNGEEEGRGSGGKLAPERARAPWPRTPLPHQAG